MMHIYLCEDDEKQLEQWKRIIDKFLLMNDTELELYCWTTSPSVLLSYQRSSDSVGIYFLDIDLNAKIDGMQLADHIRHHDPRGYIVFVTIHNEAAPLTFQHKLEAMDFITKDQPDQLESRIIDCLQCALKNHQRYLASSSQLLTIKYEGGSLSLNQNDILSITTGKDAHRLVIYCSSGIREIAGTLKELSSCLNHKFCYCSRSTIINLEHIQQYLPKERTVLMTNGQRLKVSYRMAGELKKRLIP